MTLTKVRLLRNPKAPRSYSWGDYRIDWIKEPRERGYWMVCKMLLSNDTLGSWETTCWTLDDVRFYLADKNPYSRD